MSDAIPKKKPTPSYAKAIDQCRRRVFDPDLPDGTVAHLQMELNLQLQYLGHTKNEVRTSDSGKWFQQFLDKARIRDEIDKLRRSMDQIAGAPVSEPGSGNALAAPTNEERFQQLGELLEEDPIAAASIVLAGIVDTGTDHAWRRLLVLAAEGIRFSETEDRELAPVLAGFIERLRDSNDRDDQIAVCSAIRTYIGIAAAADLDSIAALLTAGHRASPGLDTLVEIVKMVARKLTANPPVASNVYPGLSSQLENTARAYINPYVLPHGKNAAVAMNAVQAAIASSGVGVRSLAAEVNVNCPLWFRQMLLRRLKRLLVDWEERLGDRAVNHEPTFLLKEVVASIHVRQ